MRRWWQRRRIAKLLRVVDPDLTALCLRLHHRRFSLHDFTTQAHNLFTQQIRMDNVVILPSSGIIVLELATPVGPYYAMARRGRVVYGPMD